MPLSTLSRFAGSRTSTPEENLCKEWSGILEDYRKAAEIYSTAALDLPSSRGSGFDEAWILAERARKACESCRSRLLDHEHNHACLAWPPVSPGASRV